MAARAAWLLDVSHDDPDVRRRGRLLITVVLGMCALVALFAPLTAMIPDGGSYLVSMLAWCAIALLAVVLARRGRVVLAVVVVLLDYAVTVVADVAWIGEVSTGPLFCLLIVTLAGALLRPAQLAGAYLGAMALMLALPLVAGGRTAEVGYLELVVCVALVSASTAFTAAAASLDIRRSLRDAVTANEVLEARVSERTAQLEELTTRDPLTGLHNRRHLGEELPRMLTAGHRAGTSVFLAAVDVDDFKAVNDEFGHGGGDQVLCRIATCLQDSTRAGDLVTRVGGEEFVVVLTQSTVSGAQLTCERIRTGIGGLSWPGLSAELRVTVSIGLASAAVPMTASHLWGAADALLFEAKRAGKDRVVSDTYAPDSLAWSGPLPQRTPGAAPAPGGAVA